MAKQTKAARINDVTIAVIDYLEPQKEYLLRDGGEFYEVFCVAISYISGYASDLPVADAFDIARSCAIKFIKM